MDTPTPSTESTLPLDDFQKAILAGEIRAFIQGWTDATARARYTALLQAIEREELTEECRESLGSLLSVVLESGRARKLYGPAGEHALLSLFHKTPQGAALQQQAHAVTQALKGLAGQTLSSMTVRSAGPGAWALTLHTNLCELTLQIDRKGIQVISMGVDLS
ncbi:MAG: hypothetical protein NZ578_05580 [Candidatus Binatia bacterium]|nr:hypothetical protein [Candidatus Binatia bacterium]